MRSLFEHVASLGSVLTPFDVAERIAFWHRLHERLGRLSNRIDADVERKLTAQVNSRIPIPTVEELHGLQLENAEADEQFWSRLHDMHADTASAQTSLRDVTEKAISDNLAAAEGAKEAAAAARSRIDRLKKGERVSGGLGKPKHFRDELKGAGFTERELRNIEEFSSYVTLMTGGDKGEEGKFFKEFVQEMGEAKDRLQRRIVRKRLKGLRERLEILSSLDDATREAVFAALGI